MSEDLALVTGASGFVGGHVVRRLLDEGCPVRAMVRDPGKSEALKEMGVEMVEADLRDKESLRRAVDGVSFVYNIASLFRQAGFPESVFHDTNAEGVRRLFDASIESGVRRIVHCSTVGVLGDVAAPPGTEESPYNPGDMYQRTKLAGEKIAMEYFSAGKMRGVVIRPAMIFGPGDTRNLKLFRMIAKGHFFYVGKGDKFVHFIDVRDLARAFHLAMNKDALNAEVYIIAGERAVPLTELVRIISDSIGVRRPRLRVPVKPMQWLGSICEGVCRPLGIEPPIYRRRVDFFTKNRHFDGAKAARELGFTPSQSLEGEVADIVAWYRGEGWL